MADFEAWIADCHLKEFEGDNEYKCQVAVWANSYNTFRDTLIDYLNQRGLGIFWLEEVLPASQYIARYGTQSQETDELAQAVYSENVVEFGKMDSVIADGMRYKQESYLDIETINDVEPLDAQFGVNPRKVVPESLYEPLFGQPKPTDAEITKYGSVDAVPTMRTYAILDAAKMPHLLTGLIESSELLAQSLFGGEAAKELKEYSPYLVELDKDNNFTGCLLTGSNGVSGLWEKELGIYVRSRASFSEVRNHFRKFTHIRNKNDEWYYWRFWDPNNLRASLMVLSTPNYTIPKIADKFLSIGSFLLVTNTAQNPLVELIRRPFSAHETTDDVMGWVLHGHRSMKLTHIYKRLLDEGFYEGDEMGTFESDVKFLELSDMADLYEVADFCRIMSLSRRHGFSSVNWDLLLRSTSGGKADCANIAFERFLNNPKKYEAPHGRV